MSEVIENKMADFAKLFNVKLNEQILIYGITSKTEPVEGYLYAGGLAYYDIHSDRMGYTTNVLYELLTGEYTIKKIDPYEDKNVDGCLVAIDYKLNELKKSIYNNIDNKHSFKELNQMQKNEIKTKVEDFIETFNDVLSTMNIKEKENKIKKPKNKMYQFAKILGVDFDREFCAYYPYDKEFKDNFITFVINDRGLWKYIPNEMKFLLSHIDIYRLISGQYKIKQP